MTTGTNTDEIRQTIEEMCREHFNEPVILGLNIARLVGYAEDERDSYLIVHEPNPNEWGGPPKEIWNTAVGGYIFLTCLKEQGKITSTEGELWNDFTRTDNLLTLNGVPPVPEFLKKIDLDSELYD